MGTDLPILNLKSQTTPDDPKNHFEEYQAIFDAIPAHVALLNADGVIKAVNLAWRRFGEANGLKDPNFNVGDNYVEICQMSHGDCSEEANRVANGLKSVLSGKVQEFSMEYPCHSPTQDRWYRMTATTLTSGKKEGAVVMHVNVTEQHLSQIHALHSQRLESISTLAGGIAHDLNNLLTPIVMGSDLIEMQRLDPMEREVMELISGNARRGAEKIRQLLDYAQGSQGVAFSTVHPGAIIREIANIIHKSFPENIQFSLEGDQELNPIRGNPTHLRQALLNICLNARDAMKSGGSLILRTENCDLTEKDGLLPPDINPGAFIKIQISDSGPGIPKQIQNRIYDPFFTTKPLNEGTGLGLSTAQGIVQSHGGFIHLRTVLQRGATFTIYLPTSNPAQSAEAPSSDTQKMSRLYLTPVVQNGILIVDDNSSIRSLLQKMLAKMNHTSFSASNGAEGLSVFIENQSRIDLTITDISMPHLDGNVLIKAIKKMDPDHKIIAMSGLCSEGTLDDEARRLVDAFISKPFIQSEIEKALMEIMGRLHHQELAMG